MMTPRTSPGRTIPLRYDDGVRGGISLVIGVVGFAIVAIVTQPASGDFDPVFLASAGCVALIFALSVYLVWTHLLYTKSDPARLARIAETQYRHGPSSIARVLGLSSSENWSVSVAGAALAGSAAAAVMGTQEGGILLTFLALAMAITAWTTVVYAFALRYFRLHSAGERFVFEITEEPHFVDFLTTALMISSAGALSAATPTTRASLSAVRAHTVIAFAFNALVIAMTVSLIASLVTAIGES